MTVFSQYQSLICYPQCIGVLCLYLFSIILFTEEIAKTQANKKGLNLPKLLFRSKVNKTILSFTVPMFAFTQNSSAPS